MAAWQKGQKAIGRVAAQLLVIKVGSATPSRAAKGHDARAALLCQS